ncbi:Chlorophyll a-b binding protein 4, chloroplastic [Ananas comosus]|uniref:Chlorophyll a-b binding protein 4, chloroplastic n=1 Tax=Ananas comosus TaxID=4615 RepID=A0A199VBV9_ANACO|nr:Chlorophyll a-b binding protein 4, chloroplastic [Ananas comosus]
MLDVVGMLIPEVLTKIGLTNVLLWYNVGKAEYIASFSTLFVIEFILFKKILSKKEQLLINHELVHHLHCQSS